MRLPPLPITKPGREVFNVIRTPSGVRCNSTPANPARINSERKYSFICINLIPCSIKFFTNGLIFYQYFSFIILFK